MEATGHSNRGYGDSGTMGKVWGSKGVLKGIKQYM